MHCQLRRDNIISFLLLFCCAYSDQRMNRSPYRYGIKRLIERDRRMKGQPPVRAMSLCAGTHTDGATLKSMSVALGSWFGDFNDR